MKSPEEHAADQSTSARNKTADDLAHAANQARDAATRAANKIADDLTNAANKAADLRSTGDR